MVYKTQYRVYYKNRDRFDHIKNKGIRQMNKGTARKNTRRSTVQIGPRIPASWHVLITSRAEEAGVYPSVEIKRLISAGYKATYGEDLQAA